MNKKYLCMLFFAPFLILFLGCATPPYPLPVPATMESWEDMPSQQTLSNDFFDVQVKPVCKSHGWCTSFILTLKNKTDNNLELNWNKTLYISNGQTSGGFMFEGIIIRDRNNQKPPDIIFAHDLFSKLIYPNNLVSFVRNEWVHLPMKNGENGVYLSVIVNDKEINEKLTLTFSSLTIEDLLGISVENASQGVFVTRVNENGLANSKIINDDIILEVNKKKIKNKEHYYEIMRNMNIDQTILFLIYRNNSVIFVTVKIS
jgi:hypothetical protein